MIREIQIKNFKSLDDVTLELGRVNVLIGANGCGKTNILEAICLGGAAAANKLDNEYLAPRGIRYATPREMRSGFSLENLEKPIELNLTNEDNEKTSIRFNEIPGAFPKLDVKLDARFLNEIVFRKNDSTREYLKSIIQSIQDQYGTLEFSSPVEPNKKITLSIENLNSLILPSSLNIKHFDFLELNDFLIYCPDPITVRRLEDEERTLPLGINGAGLFRLLQKFSPEEMAEVKTHLRVIDWFDDFEMPDNLIPGERRLRIKDQYLAEGLQFFEQRVANEGFLFLLFYLCLFISKHTPKFFAIDNLDNGFNPKLCAYTAKTLCELAKTHDKQAIITTHNPSVLDGLDLKDDENRLFVVYRNIEGRTRIRRILPKDQPPDEPPVRLSEAFLRGYIGGLPDNF